LPESLGGTTTVVFSGGFGLLLLMHPPSAAQVNAMAEQRVMGDVLMLKPPV